MSVYDIYNAHARKHYGLNTIRPRPTEREEKKEREVEGREKGRGKATIRRPGKLATYLTSATPKE